MPPMSYGGMDPMSMSMMGGLGYGGFPGMHAFAGMPPFGMMGPNGVPIQMHGDDRCRRRKRRRADRGSSSRSSGSSSPSEASDQRGSNRERGKPSRSDTIPPKEKRRSRS